MKGIREQAMGTKEEETKSIPRYNYDDDYDDDYNNRSYENNYLQHSSKEIKPKNKDQIIISITIDESEIGEIGNIFSEQYDQNRTYQMVSELAYDKILELAGKGFESKYKIDIDIEEFQNDYEAKITLTPLKLKK